MSIDIKNCNTHVEMHCGKCTSLIAEIVANGITAFGSDGTNNNPCCVKADDLNKYLIQCSFEILRSIPKSYIFPTIYSDGKFDHYNHKFSETYNLEDFVVSGATNVLEDADILLVSGEAGIGKSTFMKELYLATVLYSLRNNCTILPIYFQAERFGSNQQTPEQWINSYLQSKYRYLNLMPAIYTPEINVVLFVDAINDIQYTDYEDFKNKLDMWQEYISNLLEQGINIKIVISSRYIGYLSDFEMKNYVHLFIKPFDDKQVQLFIDKSCKNNNEANRLKKFIEANGEMLPFLKNPFFLSKIISRPITEYKCTTDVINTFIYAIFQGRNKFIRNRRERRNDFGKEEYYDLNLDGTTFFSAMSELAYLCQSDGKTEFTKNNILTYVPNESQQFIDYAISNSLIVKTTKSSGRYKFSHAIFQEYFAGRKIAQKLENNFQINDLVVFGSEDRLCQSLKHVYNVTDNKEYFIDILLQAGKLRIAGECVLENVNLSMVEKVTTAIINSFKNKDLGINTIHLGGLLGKLGDPRFPIHSSKMFVEPPLAEIQNTNLSVGIYPITNQEYSYFIKDHGYDDKSYWTDFASFWFDHEKKIESIYRFWHNIRARLNQDPKTFYDFCRSNRFDKELIANLVYFKTISDDDLISIIRSLYSEEKDKIPLMWHNPLYNNPSQPVIGVSIYEAFAYCNWLSSKTGKKFRLLTNDEWELIAYSKQRDYAYGNKYNNLFSNSVESEFERIIVVGLCDKNKTPDGVFDLTGNVFEWTSSIYNNTIVDALYTQFICKGGSWIQASSRARSKYIGRGMGWVRNLDLGFRVCVSDA